MLVAAWQRESMESCLVDADRCWVVLVESAIIGANERMRSQAEKEMEDVS